MKIVIIGGASAYTPDIVAGFLKEKAVFTGWELALHDIDGATLDIVARLVRGMIRLTGADMTVTATTDRAEAVSDARFILTQPRVGGLRARALDERIPLQHGVIGQETLGPGGMAFAWRSIPVILDIMAEVQRLAPQAWVINYANPAGMVTEAVVRQFPESRFIGLCDMPTGIQWYLGKLFRVDYHRLDLEYAGVNHGGWCDHVLLDGVDVSHRIRWLNRLVGPFAALAPLSEVSGTLSLAHRFRMVPDPYLRYYYYRDLILKKLLRTAKTRAEVIMERLPHLYGHYEAAGATQQPVLTMHRGHQSHGDLASQLIAAMASGRRERFVIQQRNADAVPNLPADQAAQFPAWVSGNEFVRIPVPPLQENVAPLILQIKAAEAANVTAALTGDRAMAVEAAAMNPLVPDRAVAGRLVDELLAAHRTFLPQFFA